MMLELKNGSTSTQVNVQNDKGLPSLEDPTFFSPLQLELLELVKMTLERLGSDFCRASAILECSRLGTRSFLLRTKRWGRHPVTWVMTGRKVKRSHTKRKASKFR